VVDATHHQVRDAMTALVVAAVVLSVVVWPHRRSPRTRLARLTAPTNRPDEPTRAVRPGVAVVGAVTVVGALVAGAAPVLLVLAGGAALTTVVRRARPPADEDDVALLVDLLASCLAAGVPTADAVLATSAALPGRRARSLQLVGARLRDGDPPAQAWAPWLDDPAAAPVARACARGAASGAAVAAELERAAARIRAARAATTQRRVAAAAVWVVLPLGLCFLPAFVLVGVVPIAIGLVEQMH
jgi:pilus assembly protein TadC